MPGADAGPAELLAWDSEFWGFGVGRVAGDSLTPEGLEEIDAWAAEKAVRCVYFLAAAEDPASIRAAEDGGFRLAEIRLGLRRPKRPVEWDRLAPWPEGVLVRESRPEDREALRRIATDRYHDSRFYADPNFPRERAGELYATWIERSMEGYQGDTVLVAEVDGEPAGFTTVADEGASVGRVSLIAVDSSLAEGTLGPRVSHALGLAILRWGEAERLAIRCFTQGSNVRAQRFIQRFGFVPDGVWVYFHKWYEEDPAP